MEIRPIDSAQLKTPRPAPAAAPSHEIRDTFTQTVRVKIFPQDPLVGNTEGFELPSEVIGTRLESERIKTEDRSPIAIADPDGNYDYEVGTPQFDQVNAHAVVASTLSMYDRYLGRPARWAFSGPLTVNPHAGTGKTAYYSRWDRSINFFEWLSSSLGKRVTTAQSADVIAHEIGHAVWDGIRPRAGYSNEAGAFHEAFGDCSALLQALQHPTNLVKALEQNGGDFSRPSLLSRMAEEFGTAFNKEDRDPNNDNNMYYRTALNEFRYIDPRELPDDDYPPTVPENVLTREFHSFSRVWTGTFYNMLGALYEARVKKGDEPLEALTAARDQLGNLWGKGLDELPPTGIRFRLVGESMLTQAMRGGDLDVFSAVASVLVDRRILTQAEVDAIRSRTQPELKLAEPEQVLAAAKAHFPLPDGMQLEAEPLKTDDGRTIMLFTAPERHAIPSMNLEGDQVEVELRSGLMLAFDAEGKLINSSFTPVDAEAVADARTFITDLDRRGRLADNIFKSEDPLGRPYLARALPDRPGVRLIERVPVFD